jgi:hypothetical protein
VTSAVGDTIESRFGGEARKDSKAEEIVDEDEEDGEDDTPSIEQYSTRSSPDPDIGPVFTCLIAHLDDGSTSVGLFIPVFNFNMPAFAVL